MRATASTVLKHYAFIAAVLVLSAAAAPQHCLAGRARARVRSAKMREAPPAVALNQIHAFGSLPAPFALEAKSAMLIDARTGTELYGFNEHEKMQPASLAKIMTFYLTLDALKQKRITPQTEVNISEAAWRLSIDQSLSHMFLQVGQKVSVQDLLYGLMVSSGDDAAVALGEYLGGSSDAFTNQMNDKAKELGLTETHFGNPDGLPVEGQYTTAADMAKLGRALLEHFPEATTYTATKDFTFHNINQRNFNTLLFYDPRVNGIKTGHVNEAGYHLVASAQSQGMMLISAVMGTRSMEKRRVETKKLLDWAFRTFNTVHPDWHKAVPATIRVYKGAADQVALAPTSDSFVTVQRGKEGQVTSSYIGNAKYLVAPVNKGDVAGNLVVMQESSEIARIPVVAQKPVPLGGLFKRLGDRIRLML